jgi:hypothetical protein
MTEPATPKRRPVRPIGPLPVWTAAAGAFCVALAALALQVRAGADPALGAAKPVVPAQVASARPEVVVRRLEERRVVTHVVDAPAVQAAGGTGGAGVAPSPASAPAVAAAPAPAPAPAPAVTRAS